jgi:hypothetical protein
MTSKPSSVRRAWLHQAAFFLLRRSIKYSRFQRRRWKPDMPTIVPSHCESRAPHSAARVGLLFQLLAITLLISALGFELSFRIGSFDAPSAAEPGERPDLLYLEGP